MANAKKGPKQLELLRRRKLKPASPEVLEMGHEAGRLALVHAIFQKYKVTPSIVAIHLIPELRLVERFVNATKSLRIQEDRLSHEKLDWTIKQDIKEYIKEDEHIISECTAKTKNRILFDSLLSLLYDPKGEPRQFLLLLKRNLQKYKQYTEQFIFLVTFF